MKSPPIPEKTKQRFDALVDGSLRKLGMVCLASGHFRDTPTYYICVAEELPDGTIELTPVALMIEPEFMAAFREDIRGFDGEPLQNRETGNAPA